MRQTPRVDDGRRPPAVAPSHSDRTDEGRSRTQLRCRKTNSQRCVLNEDRYSQRHPDIPRLGFQGLPLLRMRRASTADRARSPGRGSAQLCTSVRSLA